MRGIGMLKRVVIVALLLCSLVCESRPWILLFGSMDCDECTAVKQTWQAMFNAADSESPVLVFVNIDASSNYRFLRKVEQQLGKSAPGDTFPVLLVGDQLVNGKAGFESLQGQLDELLKKCPGDDVFAEVIKLVDNATGSVVNYDAAKSIKPTTATTKQAQRTPNVLFFTQQGCKKCSRQSRELELLKETIPNVTITEVDVATIEGQAMLTRARKHFELPGGDVNLAPMVMWAEGFGTDRLVQAEEIIGALQKPLTGVEFWLEPLSESELRRERSRLDAFVSSLTVGVVIGGGLLDGINPCAFATSVFLISYLLYLKKSRREILLVGSCFCLGVFLTYFLYGLALSHVLGQLGRWPWIKMVVYGALGLCGLVLCGLHLRDAFRYRRTGKASDMEMGLSKETHRGIHDRIKRFTTVKSYLLGPAAVLLGGLVSSMELACTGQVYFPVLAALMKDGVTPRSLGLLLIYNLCFLVPLVVITVLAAYGVGAKALGEWARRNVFSTKVLMAGLFAVLGLVMIVMSVMSFM